MSFRQPLEDGDGSFGSQQINNTPVDDRLDTSRNYREAEIEIVVMRTLERFVIPTMEDLVRRLVKEGMELTIERLWNSMNRNPENEMLTSEPRSLKLQFVNEISPVILTGKKIVGKEVAHIKIALVDSLTGKVVNCGPEASAKVEIVVLEADSGGINGEDWTPQDFDSKIVREMQGRKTLLVGNVHLNLKEGICFVTDISFTHTSSWMKSRKLSLGAKVVGNLNGIRVKEAKTEPFTLKDSRCTYREKHGSLSLDDEVWRLKRIARDGPFHKRLIKANIKTMKDFLVRLSIDPQGLKQILNGGDKMWKMTVHHARECVIDKTVYVYPSPSFGQKTWVVFNVVGQVLGLLSESQYVPMENLSQTEKADAVKSVVSAFEHSKAVVSFVDESELMHGSSRLFSDPSNSTGLEAPNGNNMVNRDVASPVSFFSIDTDVIWSCLDPDVPAAAVVKRGKRWTMVSCVTKFLTMKRIVAIEETHVPKKMRCC